MQNREEFRKENGTSADFRDTLIQATWFNPNRSLSDTIEKLKWGPNFMDWSSDLLIHSLAERREFGKMVYVEGNTLAQQYRVMVQSDVILGSADSIDTIIDLNWDKNEFTREKAATHLHTHGVLNHPPSPQDCSGILLPSDHPYALTCVSVLTQAQKFVIFRGALSPTYVLSEVEKRVKDWNARIDSQRTTNPEGYQARLLYSFATDYDWRIFVAPTGSDTLTRVRVVEDMTRYLPTKTR